MTSPKEIADREIDALRDKYLADVISLEEYEDQIGAWLKWQTLDDFARRQYEMDLAKG